MPDPVLLHMSKRPVTTNMVLCFIYGCIHNSLWESCKFSYTGRVYVYTAV